MRKSVKNRQCNDTLIFTISILRKRRKSLCFLDTDNWIAKFLNILSSAKTTNSRKKETENRLPKNKIGCDI